MRQIREPPWRSNHHGAAWLIDCGYQKLGVAILDFGLLQKHAIDKFKNTQKYSEPPLPQFFPSVHNADSPR